MTQTLRDLLAERIAASGPMPFAAYMSLALYHPKHGYYTGGAERVGWRGHFLTSPELDPAFGGLWARAFTDIWHACGEPESFVVTEIGPGTGAFAAAVLGTVDGPFAAALHYRLVERSPQLRKRQEETLAGHDRIEWSPSITEVSPAGHGCVFANEVLDNLPVHLAIKRDGRLLEVCVDAVDGRLDLVELPPSSPELARYLERSEVDLPEGHRFEVGLAAEAFATRAAAMIGAGAIVFVDYGADANELVERPEGTLLAYSGSGTDDLVLERPGEKDITAHANWTTVARTLRTAGLEVAPMLSQRRVLEVLGLHELHDRLRADHDDAVASGRGADALAALSRRQALGALADPGGLGRLGVLVATKGITWQITGDA